MRHGMQNMELQLRTVQIRRPRSRHFHLSNVPPGLRLAPGMSATFTVEYKRPKDASETDVADVVTVWTEGASHPLELRATVPRARFILDGDLDFGVVPAGSTLCRDVTITNTGQVTGDWTLASDGDVPVLFAPTHGSLEPGTSQTVSISLKDIDAGQAASDLVLTAQGEQPLKRMVKVTAVNTSTEILEPDGKFVSQVCIYIWLSYASSQ